MRICIFGAGAVGSHFAVRLALSGHDVSCVMRGSHLEAVKANGLTLYVLPAAQLAARFSANEARPSEASLVWRLAACILTRRA